MSIQNITGLIGNTSLLKIEDKVQYYAKIEGSNSFGSAKGALLQLISKGIVVGASKNRNYSSLRYIEQLQIGMSRAAG